MLSLFLILLNPGCERPSDYNQEDDGLPPAVPSGLNLYFAGDGEVLFEWISNNEADFRVYNIYKLDAAGRFIKTDFTYDNYYLDDSLCYDSTYIYKVSSEDIWGRESTLSQEITAMPENKYRPSAPRFKSINARNWEGNISVYLSWERNAETDIAGYYIYRNINPSFTPDSSSLSGFSREETWTDTSDLSPLTIYYYKICAVDKGELISNPGVEVSDRIHYMPELIFPVDGEKMNFPGLFRFTSAGVPANYKIIVQSNIFYGTLWEKDLSPGTADDTLEIIFNYPYVEENKEYYWRVISYSGSSEPNSITKLSKFTLDL